MIRVKTAVKRVVAKAKAKVKAKAKTKRKAKAEPVLQMIRMSDVVPEPRPLYGRTVLRGGAVIRRKAKS